MSDDEDNDKDKLKTLIDGLSDREREVLRQRFGIERDSATDLEILERQFEITREKIREIEEKARKKLDRNGGPDGAA